MPTSVTPVIDSLQRSSTGDQVTLEDSSSSQDRRIQELEERLERQAGKRDRWTFSIFAFSAVALAASVFAVGLGSRAVSESKRNVKAGAAAAASAPVVATPPHVTLSDFKLGLSATTFPHGQLALTMSNAGAVPHELLVFRSDLAPSAYPLDADGNIIEESPGVTLVSDGDNVDPGKSQERTIDLTTPGKYLFVCNIPGHFKAGMFTQVTVS